MALFDWNDDGKNDLSDDWIEYQIYKDVTGDTDMSAPGSHSYGSLASGTQSRAGISGLWKLLLGIIVLIVIVSVYNASRPKCADPDCDNSPEDGSIFCLLHDPDRYKGLGSNTSVTAAATYSRPETTTTYRAPSRSRTTTVTTRETDEYDARDYIDPEDFYEDHYDDFYDYEEAEEYLEEYGEDW